MSELLDRSLKRELLSGWLVIVLGVFGLGAWTFKSDISQAALATGLLEPAKGSLMVQHKRGGVVREIHVKAGDQVDEGAPLLTLISDDIQAELKRLENRLIQARAKQHRLMLEFEGLPWSTPLDLDHQQGRIALSVQRQIYQSGETAYLVEKDILKSKLSELAEERIGIERELEGYQKQVAIVSERLRKIEKLAAQRLVSQTDRLNLTGREADLLARIGTLKASIARVDQRKAEAELRLEMQDRDRVEALSVEMSEQQLIVEELFDQIKLAEIRNKESVLYAEHAGLVTDLSVTGRGEVIAPGQAVMRLVPEGDDLIIKGQIKPDDIELMLPGSPVDVRFSAYSLRGQIPIRGTLKLVSADLVQSSDGGSHYEIEVTMEPESLRESQLKLYPGMQAQLTIKGDEQPVWRYLFGPLVDSFGRAMREA